MTVGSVITTPRTAQQGSLLCIGSGHVSDRLCCVLLARELAPLARKHINVKHGFKTYWDEFGRLGVS